MVDLPDGEREERVRRSRIVRKEGRATVEKQIDTLSDIDEKAIQIFRGNLVLSGILVSAFSIVVDSDPMPSELLTIYIQTGGFLLFLGTVIAAITYTSTTEQIGISAPDVSEILNQDYDYQYIEEGLAEQYGEYIEHNYAKNAANALLLNLTLTATVGAITYLFIGVLDLYSGFSITPEVHLVVLGFFVVFWKFAGMYKVLPEWYHETEPLSRLLAWLKRPVSRLLHDEET
ncbi:hypothetical protein [Halanaeroarchaeum sulfurireducens]|uniref:Uncharacterized protein n=1 Tax=Halanaeroarchaeum sulfurireducens TaxID=1604004 RepID=A0A0F7PDL0_9EURY|nr:hypothetical protein [Halanaeroarchaeum sulfurireducens]AKH98280.1 hypothetical protein HLASF_1809 [Halanaeroarchaeum sulfurireducens]ALG82674.1 hypothetical protein HLASA_1795 [Halanaeroarchaeum sulfurireducens]